MYFEKCQIDNDIFETFDVTNSPEAAFIGLTNTYKNVMSLPGCGLGKIYHSFLFCLG